jgi:hypothetical protein
MTTMDDLYGDGSWHEACVTCGFCKECLDCRCTEPSTGTVSRHALTQLMSISEKLSDD